MATWISEKDLDLEQATAIGLTINAAFLREIKDDFGFRKLLTHVYNRLNAKGASKTLQPHGAAALLADLRDSLKTYFALEEFYGYFADAPQANPGVSQKASRLQSEHESLFLMMNAIVEKTEQVAYKEIGTEFSVERLANELEEFCIVLAAHEEAEMDLMMQFCNEDFGVGD